jgi:hypothetical protein
MTAGEFQYIENECKRYPLNGQDDSSKSKITSRPPTKRELARRLNTSEDAIYYWL